MGVYVDHNHVEYPTLKSMCDAHGITSDLFIKRRASGKSIRDCLCTPVGSNGAKKDRLGERCQLRSGLWAEIVKCGPNGSIAVMFEDGEVVNTTTKSWSAKSIKHPTIKTHNQKGQKYLNRQVITTQGRTVTIVEYNTYNDITVAFEDGTTKHTDIKSFNNGNIAYPTTRTSVTDVKDHIGEQSTNSSKKYPHTLTIIDAVSSTDITIQFEDGVILEHCKYHDFKTHRIAHPNDRLKYRVGEASEDRNGLHIVLAKLLGSGDCLARYDNGVEVKVSCKSFRAGFTQYPEFPKVGMYLKNFKINDNLYVKHEIYADDTNHGEYYICISQGSEVILTKKEVIDAISETFNISQ